MNIPVDIVVVVLSSALSILGFGFWVIWQNTKAISTMNSLFSAFSAREKVAREQTKDQLSTVNNRLNNHSAKIEAHAILLTEHEVKIKELEQIKTIQK